MTYYARVQDGTVIDVMVLADQETGGASFLSDLFGGDPADYIPTADTHPGVGATWDGKTFTADTAPDPVAAAYERGKADGVAEQVALSVSEAL